MDEFLFVKQKYIEAREGERKKIVAFLKEKGIKVHNDKNGSGCKKYTSGGKLETTFDLSYWKWVDISYGEFNYLISLQSFDRDPSSKNVHILLDRIGLYKYKEYDPHDAFSNMFVTNIDLPLTEEKLNCLFELL